MQTVKELVPEKGWATAGHVRLPAPPPAERGIMFRTMSAFSGFFGRPEVPDVITVLNLNPRLFWPWLIFASRLMPYGRLPGDVREKIILRTAWNCRSRYEWGQHVEIGLAAGLTDEDVRCIAEGPEAWSDPFERALMQACDDMHENYCISTPVWELLSQHYGKALLVEVTILIGHYQMIAGFLNSAGLVLEAPIEEKLQALHRRLASR